VDLARYAADDMTESERAAFEPHLHKCPACQASLDEYARLGGVWEETPEQRKPALSEWLFGPGRMRWMLGAASAAILALVLMLVPFGTREGQEGLLRPKGYWKLHAAAERNGKTFRVADGSVLETGDRLGFFYTSEKKGHLMILYMEESGRIVRLYPARSAASGRITIGKNVRIPDGAVLSPGSGCEWIVGLFSEKPLSVDLAKKSVSRMLRLRKGCKLDPGDSRLKKVDLQVIQVIR
jgi:hypothetical protein